MSAAQVMPHEDRRTYLGSHDTAGIVGCSPYLTPMQVFINKTREDMPKRDEETTGPMYWGKKLEPIILAEFSKRMKVELEPERFVRHEKLAWFGGTPDGTVVGMKAGVDAKNSRYANPAEWGDPGTDEVPTHIAFQAHHFMTLMDYDVWYIAVLFSGNDFRTYCIERDKEMSDLIIELDGAFWRDHVESRTPPPIDGSESCSRMLNRMYPTATNGVRDATDDEVLLLNEYGALEAIKIENDEKIETVKNYLKDSIKTSAGIRCKFGRASYYEIKGRESIDVKALCEDHPGLAAKYLRVGEPSRALKVTIAKERPTIGSQEWKRSVFKIDLTFSLAVFLRRVCFRRAFSIRRVRVSLRRR